MTYEYICTSCGHQWEAEQPISASPLKKCPSCSRATAKRQISGGTGFLLKGGGWYADGYGSSGTSSNSSKESSAEPSSPPAASKPESKPSTAPAASTTEKAKPKASGTPSSGS